MTRIILAIVLLATVATVALPTRPACKTVYHRGRPWCVCWQTGRGWQPAPKVACSLWEPR